MKVRAWHRLFFADGRAPELIGTCPQDHEAGSCPGEVGKGWAQAQAGITHPLVTADADKQGQEQGQEQG